MEEKTLRTLDEIKSFFKDFNDSFYSFDTETMGPGKQGALRYTDLSISGISFCDGSKACYIPIKNPNKMTLISYIEPDKLFAFLKENVFKDKCKGKVVIAQNFPFDGMVTAKYGVEFDNTKLIFDTLVAIHLIDENRQHNGLKVMTREFLKKEVVEFSEVGDNHYSESFFKYGTADAVNTWELAKIFNKQLLDKGLKNLFYQVESEFQKSLVEMKVEGVDIDLGKVEEIQKQLDTDLFKTEITLYESLGEKCSFQKDFFGNIVSVGGKYNFNSSHQLSVLLFDKLHLQVVERTPTGRPKTGELTLKTYKEIPFVKCLKKYKVIQKLNSAFFKPLPGHVQKDGRVRPNFRDTGARTGRLSSNSPNLQQLPKPNDVYPVETRECFTVPPGHKMFSCDYSGQELRVMAHLSNEPDMIKAFKNEQDLHLSVANSVWKLGIADEVLKTDHPDYKKTKKEFGKFRSRAKSVNFGLAYGISKYGLAKSVGCSEDEAQQIITDYFNHYTALDKAIKDTHKEVKQNGYVKNIFGRYRHFAKENGKYPPGAFRQSFNFKIQSSSADMIRCAANKCYALERQNPEWGMKMIMTVHDEIVFKVLDEFVGPASEAVKHAFETAVDLKVPIVADIEVGTNYGNSK